MGINSILPMLARANFSNLARKKLTFELRAAVENDREEILKLLRKSFFPENPLVVYSNLISEDNRVCEEMVDYSIKPLDNPSWNIVAINEKEIIGVLLSREVNRENYSTPNVPNVKSTKFATFIKFWMDVRKEADLFEKFPDVDKVFLMQCGCVDDRFRRHHLGQQVYIRALDYAKQLGYKMVLGECASVYAAEGCKKSGFQSIYTLKYEDYKVNNQRIFKASPPQDRVEILVKRI